MRILYQYINADLYTKEYVSTHSDVRIHLDLRNFVCTHLYTGRRQIEQGVLG